MSSASKPGILLSVIAGDYMPPETLALVARCSKQAHESITPLLRMKLQSADEMRKMVLRFYPTISAVLPEEAEVEYYRGLIYFTVTPAPNFEELHLSVGSMLLTPSDNQRVLGHVYSAMRSAEGRRSIMRSIGDWQNVGLAPEVYARGEDLKDTVHRDFAIRFLISSRREALCRRRRVLLTAQ